MCKGGNPNTFKLKIKLICGIILRVWRSGMHRKKVTFLAGNFTMEKALFKNIFWHKIFICQPILSDFLRLLECKMVTCSYFS